MSQETPLWLNTMVLIGMTESRKGFVDPVDPYESRNDTEGRAWHYNVALQGAESNHYPEAIPVEDVRRRLFYWRPEIVSPYPAEYPIVTSEGVETVRVMINGAQCFRPRGTFGETDQGELLCTFGSTWKEHVYDEWLIKKVEALIDGEAQIGSAGLLEGGGVAFVSIETPEWIETPEGVAFKPRILAVTSINGSISSTYKGVITNAVCDNTMRAGLGEGGAAVKIRHTTNSIGRMEDVRKELGISFKTLEDEFSKEVAKLTAEKMPQPAWNRFLDHDDIAPLLTKTGQQKDGAALTRAENKRVILNGLWNEDPRVAPWKDTVYGAVQVMNTYDHHLKTVRNTSGRTRSEDDVRAERNAMESITGGFDRLDAKTAMIAMAAVR